MILLAELWFLVSTAILHFANWRCRKKKQFKLSIQHHQMYSSRFVNFLRLATLVLVVPSCFSSFSSFNTNFSSIMEAESSSEISYAPSTLGDKTFHQRTSQNYFKNQVFLHFSNMVSTKTENTQLFLNHFTNFDISTCSSRNSLKLTCLQQNMKI